VPELVDLLRVLPGSGINAKAPDTSLLRVVTEPASR
jgi:hypothetical protein